MAACSLAAVALVAPLSGPAAQAAQHGVLGTERWTTQSVAPGVTVRTVTITNAGRTPYWTVVEQPGTSPLTGAATAAEVGPPSWAATAAGQVRAAGFQPRIEDVRWPDYADTPHGPMGQRVRVGAYSTQADAQTAATAIRKAGLTTAVVWTGYDIQQPADLENIHVAVIDPRVFRGKVRVTHDGNVAQRETTSAVASKLGSLVATNGGFFVTSSSDGVQGIQSGLGVHAGRLAAMASGSRAALVVRHDGRSFGIENLTSTVTVRAGAASFAAQGVNRTPGLVRDCGRPNSVPTTHPVQDVTCTAADDLVVFTPEYGVALPTGTGVQVVLDGGGRVVSAGARGGTVPAGGVVLQGIGTAATWLTVNAQVGGRLRLAESVRDAATGRPVTLGDGGTSIASAAPVLVRDGRIRIDAAAEGVVDPADLSFGYAWANDRQPRTIAGITARGALILVTVDGRVAGGSEGFTLYEEAAFMRSLGAVQAMNLDGGGSTAMAVDGKLVNNTSDATGERAVGDTVQVLP